MAYEIKSNFTRSGKILMVVAACTIFIPPFWPGWVFLCAATLYCVRIRKGASSKNQEYERYEQTTHAGDKRRADYEDDDESNYSESAWHSDEDEEFEYKMSTGHKLMAVVAGIVMALTLGLGVIFLIMVFLLYIRDMDQKKKEWENARRYEWYDPQEDELEDIMLDYNEQFKDPRYKNMRSRLR